MGVEGYGENADLWLKQRVRLINSEQKLRTNKKINKFKNKKEKEKTDRVRGVKTNTTTKNRFAGISQNNTMKLEY